MDIQRGSVQERGVGRVAGTVGNRDGVIIWPVIVTYTNIIKVSRKKNYINMIILSSYRGFHKNALITQK